jgi:hypothetical protein
MRNVILAVEDAFIWLFYYSLSWEIDDKGREVCKGRVIRKNTAFKKGATLDMKTEGGP